MYIQVEGEIYLAAETPEGVEDGGVGGTGERALAVRSKAVDGNALMFGSTCNS